MTRPQGRRVIIRNRHPSTKTLPAKPLSLPNFDGLDVALVEKTKHSQEKCVIGGEKKRFKNAQLLLHVTKKKIYW